GAEPRHDFPAARDGTDIRAGSDTGPYKSVHPNTDDRACGIGSSSTPCSVNADQPFRHLSDGSETRTDTPLLPAISSREAQYVLSASTSSRRTGISFFYALAYPCEGCWRVLPVPSRSWIPPFAGK